VLSPTRRAPDEPELSYPIVLGDVEVEFGSLADLRPVHFERIDFCRADIAGK
jgi:hypothetical protein